jgi:hypothetical protein
MVRKTVMLVTENPSHRLKTLGKRRPGPPCVVTIRTSITLWESFPLQLSEL